MTTERSFNPIKFGFEWTEDGWYSWDRKAAHKAALRARNIEAKRLEAAGYTVRKSSSSNQLVTVGGIGTGHPEISEWVTAYHVEVR